MGIGVISPLTQLLKSCVECAFGDAGIEAGGLARCFPALTVRGIKEEEGGAHVCVRMPADRKPVSRTHEQTFHAFQATSFIYSFDSWLWSSAKSQPEMTAVVQRQIKSSARRGHNNPQSTPSFQ